MKTGVVKPALLNMPETKFEVKQFCFKNLHKHSHELRGQSAPTNMPETCSEITFIQQQTFQIKNKDSYES